MAFERRKIEEELLPNYRPGRYPIIEYYDRIHCAGRPRSWAESQRASSFRFRPGPASSHKNWQVEGKLGYGSQSTVWFVQDYESAQYAAIKVLTNDSMVSETAPDSPNETEEAPIMVHLEQAYQGDAGYSHIVRLLDDYYSEQDTHVPSRAPPAKTDSIDRWSWHNTTKSLFQCLVMEPMIDSLGDWQRRAGTGEIPLTVVKHIARQMLQALEYMHRHGVAHNDIRADNIFINIGRHDRSKVFEDYMTRLHCAELDEQHDFESILDENAPVQSLPIWNPDIIDHDAAEDLNFCLGDFGSAVLKSTDNANPAGQWRAPEVLLGAGWHKGPTDIWDLGSVLWELVGGRNILTRKFRPDDNYFFMYAHLAQLIELVGEPHPALLERSQFRREFFNEDGDLYYHPHGHPLILNHAHALTPASQINSMTGHERLHFLSFIRQMLQWLPEERSTAKQLLKHSWLRT
ncbi:MAG: hypothetical protein M1836_006099 [Candelina mexicana]|nr:MAG: hypothetical protein M1836_006099 [Candelina mexicana]